MEDYIELFERECRYDRYNPSDCPYMIAGFCVDLTDFSIEQKYNLYKYIRKINKGEHMMYKISQNGLYLATPLLTKMANQIIKLLNKD